MLPTKLQVLETLIPNPEHNERLLLACHVRLAAHYRDVVLKAYGEILGGSLKGLKLPAEVPHLNMSFSQVIGTYEGQIQALMAKEVTKYKRFVEFGCACGVYTNGMAFAYGMTSLGIDLDDVQVGVANECTRLNGLSDVQHISETLGYDPNRHVEDGDCIMIDIEGYEWDLLAALRVEELPTSMFVIELHEFGDKKVPDTRAMVEARFSKTHDVRFISELTEGTTMDPEAWQVVERIGIKRNLVGILLAEMRWYFQEWAVITPKA